MRGVVIAAAALAAAALLGCAQARADVSAHVSVYADAGATSGSSSSPTAIDQTASDDGAGGVASAGWGWPLASFPSLGSVDCAAAGCSDRSAGATASADEAAGILRAGAGASILVGNAPDPSFGGSGNVTSGATITDTLSLSKPATVLIVGTVHGSDAVLSSAPDLIAEPNVGTSVSIRFCCNFVRGEGPVPIGGYDADFGADAPDGVATPADDSFSVPVDLPAGDTQLTADLGTSVSLLIDGEPGQVFTENGLADFTGTVSFHLVVPDDVVATSSSGLLPIVGGAPAGPSDTIAPTSAASLAPAPNAAGWNDGPVTVHVAATDEDGGSGVASITVSTSGAQSSPAATTDGDAVDVPVSAEGTTAVTYFATDAAGNADAPQTVTVRIDQTPPTVSYSGNAGTYGVDQQVEITCHADDALSGLATSTCADVSGPAYSFALGTNAFSAHAVDNAGNSADAQTSFTVTADAASLSRLTVGFVRDSAAYAALSPQRQAMVDRLVTVASDAAARLGTTLTGPRRAAFLRVYDAGLSRLVRGGWLTDAQAATLRSLAAAL